MRIHKNMLQSRYQLINHIKLLSRMASLTISFIPVHLWEQLLWPLWRKVEFHRFPSFFRWFIRASHKYNWPQIAILSLLFAPIASISAALFLFSPTSKLSDLSYLFPNPSSSMSCRACFSTLPNSSYTSTESLEVEGAAMIDFSQGCACIKDTFCRFQWPCFGPAIPSVN